MSDTLSGTGTRDTLHGVTGNLAAALQAVGHAPAARTKETAPRVLPQGSLFPHRPASKVIPFEAFAPATAPVTETGVGAPSRTRAASRRDTRPSARLDDQTTLDFLPPAPPAPRRLPTTVEAQIFCDAAVATATHRMLAAALDVSVILLGFALFMGVTYLRLGGLTMDRSHVAVFGFALFLIALFYGLIWMLAKTETPGMRWTRLRLINFDGFPPDRHQRALRYFSTLISIAPGCLGLLWAIVDEESLTWHDHISKTFPTFAQPERNFVRRGR